MIQWCNNCKKLLEEGDAVSVKIFSKYHILKSTIAYALDKNNMSADPSTLEHINCQFPKGENYES